MQAQDFRKWRDAMRFNRSEAARALGVSRNMPQRFEEGVVPVPLYIALACAALIRGLSPWPK